MATRDDKPVGAIGRGGKEPVGSDQESPQRPVREGDMRLPADGFQRPLPTNLGRFLQGIMHRMDTGSALQVRLPGTSRVVHDRRQEGTQDRDKKVDSREGADKDETVRDTNKRELKMRDGKAEEVRAKRYENYLGERQFGYAARAGDKGKERQLSEFEKLLIARFEEAKKLEEGIKDGKMRFLAKKVEEWRVFFEKFINRTVKKTIELAEIQEFLYRGIVKKSDAKAVVISDIIHNNGHTDKFARFGIIYQKVNSFLSKLIPGDTITKQAIADGLTSERLLYLVLAPPSGEVGLTTGLKASQGIFTSEAAEARVAEELGISLDKGSPLQGQHTVTTKTKKKKGGGLFRWLTGSDEEASADAGGVFVPWWQWGTLKRPGGFTLRRAFYSAVIILLILAIFLLLDRYLAG